MSRLFFCNKRSADIERYARNYILNEAAYFYWTTQSKYSRLPKLNFDRRLFGVYTPTSTILAYSRSLLCRTMEPFGGQKE